MASQLSPIAKPDEIRLADNLPKTRSGKIMRRLLRSIARGEPITQDVSTLENPAILDQLRGVAPHRPTAKPAKPAKPKAKSAGAGPKRALKRPAAASKTAARKKRAAPVKTATRKKPARSKKKSAARRKAPIHKKAASRRIKRALKPKPRAKK